MYTFISRLLQTIYVILLMRETMIRIYFLFFLGVFIFSPPFALSQEEITITSYYPSPYGSYNQLRAARFTVGDATVPLPVNDGVLHFQGLAADPAGGLEGDVYYNTAANTLRYFDGATWRAPGPCLRRNFGPATGAISCPANFAITMAPVRPEDGAGASATSGTYLCCPFCDDFDNDGRC